MASKRSTKGNYSNLNAPRITSLVGTDGKEKYTLSNQVKLSFLGKQSSQEGNIPLNPISMHVDGYARKDLEEKMVASNHQKKLTDGNMNDQNCGSAPHNLIKEKIKG